MIASNRIRFAVVIVVFPTRDCVFSVRISESSWALICISFAPRSGRKSKFLLVLFPTLASARRGTALADTQQPATLMQCGCHMNTERYRSAGSGLKAVIAETYRVNGSPAKPPKSTIFTGRFAAKWRKSSAHLSGASPNDYILKPQECADFASVFAEI